MSDRRFAMGVGLRRGALAEEIVTLARSVASRHHVDTACLTLFTLDSKADEHGVREAAHELGVALQFLTLPEIVSRSEDGITRSPRIEARFGVGSICEAAALAGAGPGARLVAARSTTARVACALAIAADDKPGSVA